MMDIDVEDQQIPYLSVSAHRPKECSDIVSKTKEKRLKSKIIHNVSSFESRESLRKSDFLLFLEIIVKCNIAP